MSKIRLGMLTLALSMAATSSAWADANTSWGSLLTPVCGGNTFKTCAAVTVNVVDGLSGHATVTMTVTNLSGTNGTYAGTVFTQLGMDMLPNGSHAVHYGTLTSVTDITGGGSVNYTGLWQLGTSGLSGAGISGNVIGVDPITGNHGAIPSPNTFQFVFTVTNWADSDLLAAGFAIHGQEGPNDCSTKLVIDASGNANDTSDPNCGLNVVPEPMTMVLLGTGLAGMGGTGFIARLRRKKEDEVA
jgi:hypothetical protein